MALPGNQNALGNSGGKSLNDRKLAAKVRNLSLKKIAELLEMPTVKMNADDYALYKAVLIKLAGTVLPRLNEHTGEDGEKLVITISKEVAEKNDPDSTPSPDSAGPTPV